MSLFGRKVTYGGFPNDIRAENKNLKRVSGNIKIESHSNIVHVSLKKFAHYPKAFL